MALYPTFRRDECKTQLKLGTHPRQENEQCRYFTWRYSTLRRPVTPTPLDSIGLESHLALQIEKAHAIRKCGD
jgi:hypothetical protein